MRTTSNSHSATSKKPAAELERAMGGLARQSGTKVSIRTRRPAIDGAVAARFPTREYAAAVTAGRHGRKQAAEG